MPRVVKDTSNLERLYFDTSHWNRLCDHPRRAEILAGFDHSARAVFPSMINAAELLNTRRAERRADLCSVMVALQRDDHAVLGDPESILARTADAVRRGDDTMLVGDGPAELVLRRWIEDPSSAPDGGRELLRKYTDTMKSDFEVIRADFAEAHRENGFIGDAATAVVLPSFAEYLFENVGVVRRIAESPGEVLFLIQDTAPWRAFAATVAYEFHLQRRGLLSEETVKPPGGPDMMQLTYMGLVSRFVLTDVDFVRAAKWGAELLPEGMVVDVVESADYFAEIGFPIR